MAQRHVDPKNAEYIRIADSLSGSAALATPQRAQLALDAYDLLKFVINGNPGEKSPLFTAYNQVVLRYGGSDQDAAVEAIMKLHMGLLTKLSQDVTAKPDVNGLDMQLVRMLREISRYKTTKEDYAGYSQIDENLRSLNTALFRDTVPEPTLTTEDPNLDPNRFISAGSKASEIPIVTYLPPSAVTVFSSEGNFEQTQFTGEVPNEVLLIMKNEDGTAMSSSDARAAGTEIINNIARLLSAEANHEDKKVGTEDLANALRHGLGLGEGEYPAGHSTQNRLLNDLLHALDSGDRAGANKILDELNASGGAFGSIYEQTQRVNRFYISPIGVRVFSFRGEVFLEGQDMYKFMQQVQSLHPEDMHSWYLRMGAVINYQLDLLRGSATTENRKVSGELVDSEHRDLSGKAHTASADLQYTGGFISGEKGYMITAHFNLGFQKKEMETPEHFSDRGADAALHSFLANQEGTRVYVGLSGVRLNVFYPDGKSARFSFDEAAVESSEDMFQTYASFRTDIPVPGQMTFQHRTTPIIKVYYDFLSDPVVALGAMSELKFATHVREEKDRLELTFTNRLEVNLDSGRLEYQVGPELTYWFNRWFGASVGGGMILQGLGSEEERIPGARVGGATIAGYGTAGVKVNLSATQRDLPSTERVSVAPSLRQPKTPIPREPSVADGRTYLANNQMSIVNGPNGRAMARAIGQHLSLSGAISTRKDVLNANPDYQEALRLFRNGDLQGGLNAFEKIPLDVRMWVVG